MSENLTAVVRFARLDLVFSRWKWPEHCIRKHLDEQHGKARAVLKWTLDFVVTPTQDNGSYAWKDHARPTIRIEVPSSDGRQ